MSSNALDIASSSFSPLQHLVLCIQKPTLGTLLLLRFFYGLIFTLYETTSSIYNKNRFDFCAYSLTSINHIHQHRSGKGIELFIMLCGAGLLSPPGRSDGKTDAQQDRNHRTGAQRAREDHHRNFLHHPGRVSVLMEHRIFFGFPPLCSSSLLAVSRSTKYTYQHSGYEGISSVAPGLFGSHSLNRRWSSTRQAARSGCPRLWAASLGSPHLS